MPLLASRPLIAVTAALYLAAVLAIGWWSWRRTRTARDFFIAGRRLGLVVTALAAMSASFSGFVFLGGPGLTYRIGVASLFINLPVAFTAALTCWVLAGRLRALSELREVYTIPEAFACRFAGRSPAALAAAAVLIGTVGYLGSQLLALGRLAEAILDTRAGWGAWSLPGCMLIGLAVVLGYSVLGGMLAGVYTDVLQGLLMLGTAVAVFGYALAAGGGITRIGSSIAASAEFGPGFLEPFGRVPATTALGFFFVFGICVLGQPHVLHKFYMLRDPAKLKWMPLVLAGSQSVCLLIWLGIGLAVPALVAQGRMPPLANPDDAAPLFLLGFVPDVVAGLAVAGILAAIMSTADSFLNIGSAVLVRDLPRVLGRTPRDRLGEGRAATVAVALAAGSLAYLYDDLIALLGTFAFGTFAAALAPSLALGLCWKRVSSRAAAASVSSGLVLNLGLEACGRWGVSPLAEGSLPAAAALAGSVAVLILVSWLDSPPALEPEIERLIETGGLTPPPGATRPG